MAIRPRRCYSYTTDEQLNADVADGIVTAGAAQALRVFRQHLREQAEVSRTCQPADWTGLARSGVMTVHLQNSRNAEVPTPFCGTPGAYRASPVPIVTCQDCLRRESFEAIRRPGSGIRAALADLGRLLKGNTS